MRSRRFLHNLFRLIRLFAVLLFSFLPCAPVWADGPGISVTVTDASGAVIPGASVRLRSADTRAEQRGTTDGAGDCALAVPAGRYQVEIQAAGFRTYLQSGLAIGPTASLKINAQLVVESHSETVTVAAEETGIDTSATELGEAITAKKMASVPLNGRSVTDLLALQPGVIPASSQQPNAVVMSGCTSTSPSGDLNPGNLSVSGQRETSNGFAVNGSAVEEGFSMGSAIVPNLDSIQELRVLTSNFEAEHGNYSGGQILVTTKSGSNEFHGSGFEFLRNTALDARNYFASDRAKFDRNQFGGTLGGPLKKDRAFFFVDYQGTRMTQGVETGLISVPSLADRAGDLSDRASSLTGTVSGQYWASLLSQRLGYAARPGEPYYTPGCVSPSQCVLPNAMIPQSAWSAPAQALLQYIPQPSQGTNTFSTSAYNQTLHDDKGAVRIDTSTRWGALSAYYFLDDYGMDNPYPTGQGGANVPGFNAVSRGRAQLLNLALTRTAGASTVNELRFSYMRDSNDIGQPAGGVGPSLASQGFVSGAGTLGIVPLAPQIEGVENVSLNDLTFGVDITGLTQANNTYQWADNFSKVMGKHTLKVGGGFHIDQINIKPDAIYNGSFLFQGTETGLDFADFLLGVASNYAQGDSRPFYLRNKYIGVYGQDSWRVRTNLTLNYGLRWDVLPPWREKYNQLQTLVLGEQSVVYPGAPQGLVFPGDPGIPATLAPTKYTNVAPRLGLAYSPDFQTGLLGKIFGGPGKTSVRAGYGVFYTAFEGLSAGIMSANPPYGYDYDSTGGRPLFSTPFVSAATGQSLGQPFPSPIPPYGASASNPNSSVDWSKYLPVTGVPAFYYRNVPAYSESYTLSIQRQLAANTLLTLGYVGTQAHHLLVLASANPGNAALCLSVSQPGQVMPGSPTCGRFSEGGIFTKADGTAVQVRGPFSSQFDGVTYQKTIGSSNYNALEVNLRHSSRSLELMAGYTYSKSLDDSSGLAEAVNPLDPGLSKALSAFDMRHNFVVSYRYRLPLGSILHRQNRWTEGWGVSGITRFCTGLPVTLYNNNDTSLLGTIPNGINNNGVDTPNYTAGNLEINTNPRNGQPAFNTALFSLPALGEIGTAPRLFFYGPGMANFDMALQKDVRLTESKTVQLRMEAFNVFNHAQFFGPAAVNGNISSAGFGQVVSVMPPRLVQLAAKFAF